jgi:DNA-directed RNA polymerase specialized sigma subunit
MSSVKSKIPVKKVIKKTPIIAGEEQIERLVAENFGWAEAIARSVARAWNLDWQLDGLDGGAYEALLFCARRFDPKMGVPFRAYARKRIHESSTEEARKSKAWQRSVGGGSAAELEAREISIRLFELFPELREGMLPASEDTGEDGIRGSIRQMLASASVIAAFSEAGFDNPEKALEYKELVTVLAELEPVHQSIVWGIYWGGQSMRALSEDWGIDELTIIREHKEILKYVAQRVSNPKNKNVKRVKIRPSLRTLAQTQKKRKDEPPFARVLTGVSGSAVASSVKSSLSLEV